MTEQQWLTQSPMLMNISSSMNGLEWIQGLYPHTRPPLLQAPEDIPRRLGIYYEQLVYQLLTNSCQLIDIYKNIQVFDNNRTIGEFDFLCIDNDSHVHHLECAVKFYLCDGPGDQLHHYLGPNRRDRLDKKWRQLIERQINLGSHPAALLACEKLGIAAPDHRHILLQGYLFYPYAEFSEGVPKTSRHPEISPLHQHGWWIRHSELELLRSNEATRLQARHKPDWLRDWSSSEEPKDWNPERIERPIMISRVSNQEDGNWKEVDRGFVVPDQWGAPSNCR